MLLLLIIENDFVLFIIVFLELFVFTNKFLFETPLLSTFLLCNVREIEPAGSLCGVIPGGGGSHGSAWQKPETPRTFTPPADQWQQIAGYIVTRAAETLHSPDNKAAAAALDYLHSRGISDKEINRQKIGYIPKPSKGYKYYVNPETMKFMTGISEEEKKKCYSVPAGITIPTFQDGKIYRVKVRRKNEWAKALACYLNRKNGGTGKQYAENDFRYSFISGATGGTTAALFNGPAAIDMHPRKDIIFCEGELDAMLINSVMESELTGLEAVTFGSAQARPPFQTFYKYYRTPERIVIVYDNDSAGSAGATWLQAEISKVKTRENPPTIQTLPGNYKDFGEYYAAGGNLYELITGWFPL